MNIQLSNNCDEETPNENQAYTIVVCKVGGGKTGPIEAHKIIMAYAKDNERNNDEHR